MIVLGQCSGNCFYGLFETFKSDLRHSLPILPCLKGCTVTLYRQAQLSLAHDSFGTMFWQLFLWLVRNFQIRSETFSAHSPVFEGVYRDIISTGSIKPCA